MRRKVRSIRSKRDFERVYARGRATRSGALTVFVMPSQAGVSRLGLTVPGRGTGAVIRNKVKRRLRAAFESCPPPDGLDVVVRAAPSAAGASFEDLVRTLCGAIRSGARG